MSMQLCTYIAMFRAVIPLPITVTAGAKLDIVVASTQCAQRLTAAYALSICKAQRNVSDTVSISAEASNSSMIACHDDDTVL